MNLRYQFYLTFYIILLLCLVFPCLTFSQQVNESKLITVEINDIVFQGNTVIDTEFLKYSAKKYLSEKFHDQPLTLDEMRLIADHISFIYREKGYIVAKAYVPPQEIKDGTLKIEIAEGNINKITVSGNNYYSDRLIKNYFKSPLKKGVINENNLERSLMLINDLPSLSSTMVLKKSDQHGAVDILLDTNDKMPIDTGFGYNNFGSEIVSKNLFNTFFNITDPYGGVNFNCNAQSGEDINDSYMFNTNLTIPVNSIGTKIGFDFLKSASVLAEDKVYLNIEGNTEIYGIYVSHPIIKKRNKSFEFKLGYTKKNIKKDLENQNINDDDLSLIYTTFSFNNVDRFLGNNYIILSCYYGELDTKSVEYDEDFFKIELYLSRIQKLGNYSLLLLRSSSQYTSNSILQIEKTVIGGYYYVRGYEPSIYLGDSGYSLSAEYMFPLFGLSNFKIKEKNFGEIFKLALFIDHGGINNNNPDIDLLSSKNITGCGLGFRMFYNDSIDLKFDLSFPLDNIEDNDDFFAYIACQYRFN